MGQPSNWVTQLDELVDVDVDTTPPSDGQALVWDATDGLWVPGTVAGASPLTTKGDVFTHNGSADSRLGVGTDGQVLTADSAQALGIKWATPAGGGGGMTLLSEVSPLVSSQANIEFSAISATYDVLLIEFGLRSDRAGAATDAVAVRVGNSSVDSGTNYDLSNIGGVPASSFNSTNQTRGTVTGAAAAATATTDALGTGTVRFPNYAVTGKFRNFLATGGVPGHSAVWTDINRWRNTADAIDVIRLYPNNGSNWVAGSWARLYGL